MTKFYFCGSIRGGRQLAGRYRELIEWLTSYGQVLTEHVGDDGKIEREDGLLTDRKIHDRDMAWIAGADLVIAEVSAPSLGVGYEIARALQIGKPVWCLFHSGTGTSLSAMIAGCSELEVIRYGQPEELTDRIREFLAANN
ncbi:MAG: nucleoside 2-deoxyribosyltransferase [Bacteroidales bacterium]